MFYICIILLLPICRAATPPNILLIVADDLGYNDVSWHNSDIISPNLDKLAKEGVILEGHYVQPICTPTRSALMTSFYPIHTGRQHKVLGLQEPKGLYTNFTLMPEYLKEIGYRTHMVGKWHLGFCNENYLPTRRGFDTFYGHYSGAEDYYYHFHKSTAGVKSHGYDFRDQDIADYSANGTYSSGLMADRAAEIIKEHAESYSDNPLFLYLPFQNCHRPLQVPSEYEEMYPDIENEDRRIFSGMTTALDDGVGLVIQELKNSRLMDNTIIVFTSDNGGDTMQGGNNYPLRGNKNTLWEGGTRASAFVHSTLLQHKGTINNELIHVVDWTPTLLTAVKDTLQEDQKQLVEQFMLEDWDGIDQWSTIVEAAPSQRSEFLYNIDPLFDYVPEGQPIGHGAIRIGDMKLIVGAPGTPDGHIKPDELDKVKKDSTDNSHNVAKKKVHHKKHSHLMKFEEREKFLFDIAADPYEYNNIAKDNPNIVNEMIARLEEYMLTMIPPDCAEDIEEGNPIHFNGTFAPGFCESEPN